MGNTPVCTIDRTGCHNPGLGACLDYLTAGYQAIYGNDIYLGADSQDGELVGLLSSAIDDANAMCVQAYNAYSPATAQGVGLSSNVKINGLKREVPTNSTVPLLIGGTAFTPVTGGLVTDAAGIDWSVPDFTIPIAGQLTITATCTQQGAVNAAINTIVKIKTQTAGWQTVINTANATPGAPVEADPQLRTRQSNSTMGPAAGPLGAVVSAIWKNVPGVVALQPYENTTQTPDANGIPGHSICIVLEGGDADDIANQINLSKQGGTGTYGSTVVTLIDVYGVSHPIAFTYAGQPPITASMTIRALNGFSLNTVPLIQASMAAWFNSLPIGQDVQLTRAYAAGYLQQSIQAAATQLQSDIQAGADASTIAADAGAVASLTAASQTYEIVIDSLLLARDGGTLTAADVVINYNEAANSSAPNTVVTVI